MTNPDNNQGAPSLDAALDALTKKEETPPAAEPAPAAVRPGCEVQKLETFTWKGFLWQVCGFVKAIPDGEEEASSCVVIRVLAPACGGAARAERRRQQRGK